MIWGDTAVYKLSQLTHYTDLRFFKSSSRFRLSHLQKREEKLVSVPLLGEAGLQLAEPRTHLQMQNINNNRDI